MKELPTTAAKGSMLSFNRPSFNFRLEILLLALLAAAVALGVEAGMTLDNRFNSGFHSFQPDAAE